MAFRKTDRCDRCGAQALMLAMKGDLDLLMCAHHGRMHLDKLVLEGWEIDEDFASIEPAPLTPAGVAQS